MHTIRIPAFPNGRDYREIILYLLNDAATILFEDHNQLCLVYRLSESQYAELLIASQMQLDDRAAILNPSTTIPQVIVIDRIPYNFVALYPGLGHPGSFVSYSDATFGVKGRYSKRDPSC